MYVGISIIDVYQKLQSIQHQDQSNSQSIQSNVDSVTTLMLDRGTNIRLIMTVICLVYQMLLFCVNVCIIPDWMEFVLLVNIINGVNCLYLKVFHHIPNKDVKEYFIDSGYAQIVPTFIFAILERTRKQLFVINLTNAKTKK